jgi:hypothetical protein
MDRKVSLETLAVKYGFEIIPKCPAATELNYSDQDRSKAEVLTGPVFDSKNFYYSAYTGSYSRGNFKSGIFFARSRRNGSLIYAQNVENYSLDRGNNFLGNHLMLSRSLPVISGNSIYLTGGYLTNIGPQLFCVDKTTGRLIYAIAYYLPEEVEADLGVKFITKKDDYSKYVGTNCRVSSFNPMVIKKECGSNTIYCGVSSLQNVLNAGIIPGNPNYIGYPYYTDQGRFYRINEEAGFPTFTSYTSTCAPLIKIGDTLIKGHPEYDPFAPAKYEVIIAGLTKDKITSPGPVGGKYYFAQVVQIEKATIISPTLFAPFWNRLVGGIYLDTDKITSYSLTEILGKLSPGTHTIYTTLTTITDVAETDSMGTSSTNMLWYTKLLKNGDVVSNKYEANSLNYWGNDPWGAGPLFDRCNNIIYFHASQTHSMPLDEILLGPSYTVMKQPLVEASRGYVANQTISNLAILNQVKDQYQNNLKLLCLSTYRSPRGQMSYGCAIFASSPETGRLLFAVRSLPLDVYSFIGSPDPKIYFFNPNDSDGDASSGVFLAQGKVGFTTKSGCLPILDVSQANREHFDHYNLLAVGVKPRTWVYTGPNGLLGGTNYQSVQHRDTIYTLTANGQVYLGSLELFVTRDGLYVPPGISVGVGINLQSETVIWNTPLKSVGSGSATYYAGSFLTADISGTLYALSELTGTVVWQTNSGNFPKPMLGGVASPSVDKIAEEVYWISSYDIPGNATTASGYGYVFKIDPVIAIDPSDYTFLSNRKYTCKSNAYVLNALWRQIENDCGYSYTVQSEIVRTGSEPIHNVYSVCIKGKCRQAAFHMIKGSGSNLGAKLLSARFINKQSYILTWFDGRVNTVRTDLMEIRLRIQENKVS